MGATSVICDSYIELCIPSCNALLSTQQSLVDCNLLPTALQVVVCRYIG